VITLATPSNCGKPLKPLLPNGRREADRGRVNSPGYGKNVRDIYNGQSAAKSYGPFVHYTWVKRGYGCSSQTKWRWALGTFQLLKI